MGDCDGKEDPVEGRRTEDVNMCEEFGGQGVDWMLAASALRVGGRSWTGRMMVKVKVSLTRSFGCFILERPMIISFINDFGRPYFQLDNICTGAIEGELP
jgi:hypothetical protein